MGEFETVMKTRNKVEGLHKGLPTPRAFISVYANTGKKFSIAFLNQFPREEKQSCLFKALIILFLSVANVVHDDLYAKSVLVLQKRYFPKNGFFSLKL